MGTLRKVCTDPADAKHKAVPLRIRAAALVTAALFLLSACGASGSSGNPGAAAGPTPAAPATAAPAAAAPDPTVAPEPTAAPQAVEDTVLPDPYSFFDRQIGYSTDIDKDRYFAKFKFAAEDADAGAEYIALLQDSRFGLTLADSHEEQYSGGSMYGYYTFDCGADPAVGDVVLNEMGPASLIVTVSVSASQGTYELWLCYAPDGFTFADFGDRTTNQDITTVPYAGSRTGLLGPDQFEGGGASGSDSNLFNDKCTRCQGTGKLLCPSCGGSGKTTYGYGGLGNCPTCNGERYVRCSDCGGDGKR